MHLPTFQKGVGRAALGCGLALSLLLAAPLSAVAATPLSPPSAATQARPAAADPATHVPEAPAALAGGDAATSESPSNPAQPEVESNSPAPATDAPTGDESQARPDALDQLVAAAPTATVALPFDNVGIGALGAGNGDFDGGGNYFDRAQLDAKGFGPGGTVPVPGTRLGFRVAQTADGSPDNVRANGQRIELPASWQNATVLSLIGAGTNGSPSGNLGIEFADGSSRSVKVSLADWCSGLAPGAGSIPVGITDNRATGTGTGGGGCGIYSSAPVDLAAGEQPVAVVLPEDLTNMHVFAVASDVIDGPRLDMADEISKGADSVAVAGSGFAAGASLTLTLRPGASPLGEVTSDGNGAFTTTLNGAGWAQGRLAVTATSSTERAGTGFTVVRAPVDPEHPGTPVSYVNSLIGTGNGGPEAGEINNFPGPSAPFGMVQYSPDTVDGYAGYVITDDRLKGYSMTHASVGCSAFGDIPVLPTSQNVNDSPWSQTEKIAHDDTEIGTPGYYTVRQTTSGINAELTAGTRVGLGRFEFPAGQGAFLQFKPGDSKGGNTAASIHIGEDGIVTGSASSGHFCGKNNEYTVYFAMKFDAAITGYGTWDKASSSVRAFTRDAEGRSVGGWVSFDGGQTVNVTSAISYVSVDGAKANLAEADGRDFDEVRESTNTQWNDALSKITVSGTDANDLETFYTALFHSLQHPNTFNDADGSYLGFDGKVHEVEGARTQYTNFSDWDTYRSHVQLVSMLYPDRAQDMAQSLVNAAEQSGSLPRWTIANSPTGQMTGDSVTPLIANTYLWGAKDFDAESALNYMTKAAADGGQSTTYPWYWQRRGAETYSQLGYAPQTAEFRGDHQIVGASITQEWSVDDFTISRLAAALGKDDVAEQFQVRAQNWQNLLDPASHLVLPRDRFGAFLPAPDTSGTGGGIGQAGFDEGNAAQYTLMVPQNVEALVAGLGGRDAVSKRLDAYFTELNAGSKKPYLWLGNEPNFSSPWLYNYIGEPAKTQKVVDRIRTELFSATPQGMPGNDDLGAQSSWYVWAAMGLYPATPGTTTLTLNTPVFDKVSIALPNGKKIDITAPGVSTAKGTQYIQSMTLDGTANNNTSLPQDVLDTGASIAYEVGSSNTSTWGTAQDSAPPSYSDGGKPAVFAPTGEVSVAPGGEATVSLQGQRLLSDLDSIDVVASADVAGITTNGAKLVFGADGSAQADVRLTVASTVAEGFYAVEYTAKAGEQTLRGATTVRVARPGSLASFFGLIATAPKAESGIGAFDSDGGSFQREQLAATGNGPGATVTAPNGLSYRWPASPVGRPDAVEPHGQNVQLELPATKVALVGASRNGEQVADATAWLDDGTSETFAVGLDDWVGMSGPNGTPGHGGIVIAAMSERNSPWGSGNSQVYMSAPYSAPEGRTIVAITLPEAERQRIFAVAAETPEPVGTLTLSADEKRPVAGTNVRLTAELAPASAGSVRFEADGVEVATVVADAGNAHIDVALRTAGKHSYTAVFVPEQSGAVGATSEPVVLELADPTVKPSTTNPKAGQSIQIDVAGFLPGESLVVSSDTDAGISSKAADTVTAGEDGTAKLTFVVPGNATGALALTVAGQESGLSATTTLTVSAGAGTTTPGDGGATGAADPGNLANTGAPQWLGFALLLGLGALLIGGALMRVRAVSRR